MSTNRSRKESQKNVRKESQKNVTDNSPTKLSDNSPTLDIDKIPEVEEPENDVQTQNLIIENKKLNLGADGMKNINIKVFTMDMQLQICKSTLDRKSTAIDVLE